MIKMIMPILLLVIGSCRSSSKGSKDVTGQRVDEVDHSTTTIRSCLLEKNGTKTRILGIDLVQLFRTCSTEEADFQVFKSEIEGLWIATGKDGYFELLQE